MTTASALMVSALIIAARRDPIPEDRARVSTSVANPASEEYVDERCDGGAFGEDDKHLQEQHRDHDGSEPPLLADLHEGPQLTEDPHPALFRLRHFVPSPDVSFGQRPRSLSLSRARRARASPRPRGTRVGPAC